MRIGLTEIIIIVILVLALFDPDKLKKYAANLGKAMSVVTTTVDKVKEEVVEPVQQEIVDPVAEAIVDPVKDSVQPIIDAKAVLDEILSGGKS